MHVKYALLHCSYSAPVRVSDIALVFVAARDTTGAAARAVAARVVLLPVRATVVPDVRVVVGRFDDDDGRAAVVRVALFCDAVRDTVGVAVRTVALRPATARVDAVRETV